MTPPREIRLDRKDLLSDWAADRLGGKFLDRQHYNVLFAGESVNVRKPDGSMLICYRHDVLSPAACEAAYPALRGAAALSQNRGLAVGDLPDDLESRVGNRVRRPGLGVGKVGHRPLREDGRVSSTKYAAAAHSGVIGYMDKYTRIPYCRLTAFNLSEADKFAAALPLIQGIDAVFKKELPQRYAAQMRYVRETYPEWTIGRHGTAFTTITVNKDWRTACHQDQGDLKQGFGVMAVLSEGNYTGGYLCFPKFKVAVDMRMGGVCLADVHEWHGNTPLRRNALQHRLSLVLYYREGMKACGTEEEELQRAQEYKMAGPVEFKGQILHPQEVQENRKKPKGKLFAEWEKGRL
jgi:hypothetical protein